MLSYRHAFHAGNHADVLKHSVLCILLSHFRQKEKPFTYVDSHAGAGLYRLDGEWAQKTGEASDGIIKFLEVSRQKAGIFPECLGEYEKICVELTRNFQYPGSPEFARLLSREQDSLILSELHPGEIELLRANMREDRRVHVHNRSGFELLGCLPLPPRSCILIDPSYETDDDYTAVFESAQKVLRRCSAITVAVWYPLVGRRSLETSRLIQSLSSLNEDDEKIIRVELSRSAGESSQNESGYGMYGSGMLVLNAPWKCGEQTRAAIEYISAALGMEYYINGANSRKTS